jgi:hypothetical protein
MPEIISKDVMINGNFNFNSLNFVIEFNEDGSPIDCHHVIFELCKGLVFLNHYKFISIYCLMFSLLDFPL